MPGARRYWPGPERQSVWRQGCGNTPSAASASVPLRPQSVPCSASEKASAKCVQNPLPCSVLKDTTAPLFGGVAAELEEDCCGPYQPLLKVSRPIPVGAVEGRYAVLIRRAARTQTFGLTLFADEDCKNDLEGVRVAEDLPHLGIRKDDSVVLINNVAPKSTEECLWMLQEAMSLLLVMQKAKPEDTRVDSKGSTRADSKGSVSIGTGSVDENCSGVMQAPLAVTVPVVTDVKHGKFYVAIRRTFLTQRFGVSFSMDDRCHRSRRHSAESEASQVSSAWGSRRRFSPARLANEVRRGAVAGAQGLSRAASWAALKGSRQPWEPSGGRGARIVVSVDVPHLGLCEGDRLLVINGFQPESEAGCRMILQRSRTLRLTLMRSPERLACIPALPLISLDDEEEVGGKLESRRILGCDATGGIQEDSCSIEIPGRRGEGTSGGGQGWMSSWLACTGSSCATEASTCLPPEPQGDIVGWDPLGGAIQAHGSPRLNDETCRRRRLNRIVVHQF